MVEPDVETHLLVEALAARDLEATIVAWDDERVDYRDIDLVVVRSTWDYTFKLAAFLAWTRTIDKTARLANSASVIEWNHHKSYLLELEAAGVAIVPTLLVPAGSTAPVIGTAAGAFAGEVVIKPAVAAGGRRAGHFGAGERDATLHLEGIVSSGDALVQPFMSSVARSGERSLVYLARRFSHAVAKYPGAGDFRVQFGFGGSLETYDPTPEELALAEAALSVVDGDLLYARVDLVSGESGPMIMELELIEPQLFLTHGDGAAARLALAIEELVERS